MPPPVAIFRLRRLWSDGSLLRRNGTGPPCNSNICSDPGKLYSRCGQIISDARRRLDPVSGISIIKDRREHMMTFSVIIGSTRQGRFAEEPAQFSLNEAQG